MSTLQAVRAALSARTTGRLSGIRSLYLRIYLTVVAVLLVFALLVGALVRSHTQAERERTEAAIQERGLAWAAVIERGLPPAEADADMQAQALEDWARRLRLPLALDAADGQRLATSPGYRRLQEQGLADSAIALRLPLSDGRLLWLGRPRRLGPPPWAGGGAPHPSGADALRGPSGRGEPWLEGRWDGPVDGRMDSRTGGRPDGRAEGRPEAHGGNGGRRGGPTGGMFGWLPAWLDEAGVLAALLVLLFAAVAAGAWPVVRRLTRRLEALQQGVDTFGAGDLAHRVPAEGRDEVAALARSFNAAAQRVQDLVQAHRSLLANASHELRSPLARLKMAAELLVEAEPAARERLRGEIDRDIRELDALVEEVLLASRLDARPAAVRERVDLLGLVAEEAARVDALGFDGLDGLDGLDGQDSVGDRAPGGSGSPRDAPDPAPPLDPVLVGDERLLRRAVRNLLENARRYGGSEVTWQLSADGGLLVLRVCDRGPGVPAALAERVFEPFFRLPGHAEVAGGVGLGLSLVRQIAQHHGGSVSCQARPGGGSCFELRLPRG